MPELPSPELHKFLTALDEFMENPPRDLPEGSLDNITNLRSSLKGYGESTMSPGEKEAVQASVGKGSDTPVGYKDAASGPDQPSPGQKEYEQVVNQVREAVSSLPDAAA